MSEVFRVERNRNFTVMCNNTPPQEQRIISKGKRTAFHHAESSG